MLDDKYQVTNRRKVLNSLTLPVIIVIEPPVLSSKSPPGSVASTTSASVPAPSSSPGVPPHPVVVSRHSKRLHVQLALLAPVVAVDIAEMKV